jgi:septum formation protein
MEFVLASSSPRRQRILSAVGFHCEVSPPSASEECRVGEPPGAHARRSAHAKYASIRQDRPSAIIIAADTVVSMGGQTMGKPKDSRDAVRMLSTLSSRWHRVITALTVGSPSRIRSAVTQSLVKFRTITAAEISWYLATGEPMDKAGAYGLQGAGAMLIETIEGSCTNVAGFPLESFFLLLEDILDAPWTQYAHPRDSGAHLWP